MDSIDIYGKRIKIQFPAPLLPKGRRFDGNYGSVSSSCIDNRSVCLVGILWVSCLATQALLACTGEHYSPGINYREQDWFDVFWASHSSRLTRATSALNQESTHAIDWKDAGSISPGAQLSCRILCSLHIESCL
ncbi:hypothetical protein CEXT_747271 [Caerostris extrusa]|uniref:Uncharacterized protein n=1 Tax=Caerostris extrusa TaxID=172846 RepID=A0AAV4M9P7_CAEEX|nr:hypothetical protein CEXT_747271 [Caerostris extrusa]